MVCLSCIDGRTCDTIMGTPGGDSGIVLRVLLCVQRAAQVKLSERSVRAAIMAIHKELGRPLYYHTDDHAIAHYDPRAADKEAAADEPAHVGCGYLKLAIASPHLLADEEKDQEELAELARTVVRVLSDMLRNPATASTVALTVLEGDHNEDEVVVSYRDEPVAAGGHVFVYHPKADEAQAARAAQAVAGLVGMSGNVSEIVEDVNAMREEHWIKAIGVLAPGVAHQEVH